MCSDPKYRPELIRILREAGAIRDSTLDLMTDPWGRWYIYLHLDSIKINHLNVGKHRIVPWMRHG